MKTIILPGYSEHNRDWAEEVKSKLNLEHAVIAVDWDHWTTGKPFSLKKELGKITKIIGDDKVNIIAKSVGVAVTLELIPKISTKVNKVILCGIASVVNEDRKKLAREAFSKIPLENLLCIQNENDRYVTFLEAQRFYHSINPEIRVVSKPRSDHDYPYPEDFRNFLLT